MFRIVALVFLFFASYSCKSIAQKDSSLIQIQTQKMKIEYYDGSGNAYSLQAMQLTYKPMTPEMSSSGLYSGGDPAEVVLDTNQIAGLKKLLEHAIHNTNEHSTAREKGTALINYSIDNHDGSIILKRDSILKSELESYLKSLLKLP